MYRHIPDTTTPAVIMSDLRQPGVRTARRPHEPAAGAALRTAHHVDGLHESAIIPD
jgi:hypothetical protein